MYRPSILNIIMAPPDAAGSRRGSPAAPPREPVWQGQAQARKADNGRADVEAKHDQAENQRGGGHAVNQTRGPRILAHHVDAGDAGHADRSADRKGGEEDASAPFAGRPWPAEIDDREHGEDEGVKRAREPLVNLGPDAGLVVLKIGIAGRGKEKLADIALARLQFPQAPLRGEIPDVERIAFEHDDLRILLAGLLADDLPVLQFHRGPAALGCEVAAVRDHGCRHFRITLVVHDDANQFAILSLVPHVESEAGLHVGEFARLQNLGKRDPPAPSRCNRRADAPSRESPSCLRPARPPTR